MIRFLPEAIVIAIHDDQTRLYGGLYGVRDAAALDAALHMPQAQFARAIHFSMGTNVPQAWPCSHFFA